MLRKAVAQALVCCCPVVFLASCASQVGAPEDPPVAPAYEWMVYHPGSPREQRSTVVDGTTVAYEVVDGMVVVGGDMLLGPVGAGEARLEALMRADLVEDDASARPERVPLGNIRSGSSYRWGGGVVAYVWDASCPVGSACRNAALGAMAEFVNEQVGVSFYHCPSCYSRVRIRASDSGCYAGIGRQGLQEQVVNLGPGCENVPTATHEFGHAIGMFHEHQRCDRDVYVSVKGSNIISSQGHNFEKYCWGAQMVGPYDYTSLMHYGSHVFTSNGQPTLVPKNYSGQMGNIELSCGDIATASLMYGGASVCNCANNVATRCGPGTQCVGGMCQTVVPPAAYCGDVLCNNGETVDSCPGDCCTPDTCACLSQGSACTLDAECCSAPCISGQCGAMQ